MATGTRSAAGAIALTAAIGGLALRQPDVGDHHARAGIDQRRGVLPSEQAAGAGHQRGASRQIVTSGGGGHGMFLFKRATGRRRPRSPCR